MNARARPLADDQVYAKIFHCRIEDFLDRGLQTVNLVEKENLLRFECGQDGRQVAFAFEQRSRARLDGGVELVSDDLRERGFPQAWRAVEQDVIERLIAAAGGVNRDLDIFLDALLPDVFLEPPRPHADVDARIFFVRRAGKDRKSVVEGKSVGPAGGRMMQR